MGGGGAYLRVTGMGLSYRTSFDCWNGRLEVVGAGRWWEIRKGGCEGSGEGEKGEKKKKKDSAFTVAKAGIGKLVYSE